MKKLILIVSSLLTAFFLYVPNAHAAFTIIATNGIGSVTPTTDVTSSAIDTTGANLYMLALDTTGVDNTTSSYTVTDSAGNTWTAASVADATAFGSRWASIWYVASPLTGSSVTVHVHSVSSNWMGVHFDAVSGADPTHPFDFGVATTINSVGTTCQSNVISPSNSNDLIFGTMSSLNSGPSASIDSGFTALTSPSFMAIGNAYLIQTTPSSVMPTWTIGSADYCVTDFVAFKVPAAPPASGEGNAIFSIWHAIVRGLTII